MYRAGTTLRIDMGTYFHYGIADGQGGVIHNSKRRFKVTQESYEEFSNGKEIMVSEIVGGSCEAAVNIAMRYIGMPYNLFKSNCEHFVRLCHGLERESTQVQQYIIMALGAGMAVKGSNDIIKAVGVASSIASLLTPAEESPYQNVFIASLIAAGIVVLAK